MKIRTSSAPPAISPFPHGSSIPDVRDDSIAAILLFSDRSAPHPEHFESGPTSTSLKHFSQNDFTMDDFPSPPPAVLLPFQSRRKSATRT